MSASSTDIDRVYSGFRNVKAIEPKAVRVEKGIGVPTNSRGGTNRFVYRFPILEMDIGDSFQVPEGKTAYSRVQSERQRAEKDRKGRKYTVRKYLGGHRCWRLA